MVQKKEIDSNYIIIDNNGIGYLIYVPNPYVLSLVKNILYIHIPILEKTNIHYMAFKTREEKRTILKTNIRKRTRPKDGPSNACNWINFLNRRSNRNRKYKLSKKNSLK